MALSDFMELCKEKGYEVLNVEEVVQIRKTKSGYHKAGSKENYSNVICKCPTEGCNGIVRLTRIRDFGRTCISCGVKRRRERVKREWQIYTTEWILAKSKLAKANPDLFIREEITKTRDRGTALRRVILKCPTESCNGILSINLVSKTEVKQHCCHCAIKIRELTKKRNKEKKV